MDASRVNAYVGVLVVFGLLLLCFSGFGILFHDIQLSADELKNDEGDYNGVG